MFIFSRKLDLTETGQRARNDLNCSKQSAHKVCSLKQVETTPITYWKQYYPCKRNSHDHSTY